MKYKSFIVCIAAALLYVDGAAQENYLSYRAEALGAASSSNYTPFWIASNRYGLVPLDAPNGYTSAGAFYKGSSEKFRWDAGLELVAITPRYRNVTFRQLYGELGYRSLTLTVGIKEHYTSLLDRELSSGDMVRSTNARPVPEIRISMPEYVRVPYTKGWLQLKGNFSTGRSFDSEYLKQFVNGKQTYVDDVLWHYKSLHFRITDSRNSAPLSFEFGVQHGAQWGGTSSNPKIGQQPQSLGDYVRVILGMSGDETATISDQINVLGNHFGSYDFKLNYSFAGWEAHAYHQRYFEDKSGMEFVNRYDGLWGLQLDLPSDFGFVRKILFELMETRHQSGTFHFIEFDHKAHPGVGGGADNYYNNGEYTTGLSYFNRGLGNPLIPSPEYNLDNSLGFRDNRLHNLHFGIAGDLSSQFSYRLLFTSMETWGQHYRPYLNTKTGMSGLCEITYRPASLKGWSFGAMLAADKGDYLQKKGIGGGIIISHSGILPIGKTR